jgi:hypothetical protein
MSQDLVVTLIAFATAAGLLARWWRRRKRAEPACANCESGGAGAERKAPAVARGADIGVKPVAFFGGSARKHGPPR